MTSWVEQEFATADLGDERLNQRLAKVVDTLARQPGNIFLPTCETNLNTVTLHVNLLRNNDLKRQSGSLSSGLAVPA